MQAAWLGTVSLITLARLFRLHFPRVLFLTLIDFLGLSLCPGPAEKKTPPVIGPAPVISVKCL